MDEIEKLKQNLVGEMVNKIIGDKWTKRHPFPYIYDDEVKKLFNVNHGQLLKLLIDTSALYPTKLTVDSEIHLVLTIKNYSESKIRALFETREPSNRSSSRKTVSSSRESEMSERINTRLQAKVLEKFFPEPSDTAKLMEDLIEKRDLVSLKRFKTQLSPFQYRYVLNKIKLHVKSKNE